MDTVREPLSAADAPLDLDLAEILAEDEPSSAPAEPPTRPQPELAAIAADIEETVGEMAAEALRREPVPPLDAEPQEADDAIARLEADDPAALVLDEPDGESPSLTFLDTGSFDDEEPPAGMVAAHESHGIDASEIDAMASNESGFVSYSEPVIAPRSEQPESAAPLHAERVPAVPDRDLQVAASLEAVARRIRAGDLVLPGIEAASEDAALAIALAALMAARH